MVMKTLYWKLIQKYFISDQTNINFTLSITAQETVSVLAVMKIQEKVTGKLYTYWNEIPKTSYFIPLTFLLNTQSCGISAPVC